MTRPAMPASSGVPATSVAKLALVFALAVGSGGLVACASQSDPAPKQGEHTFDGLVSEITVIDVRVRDRVIPCVVGNGANGHVGGISCDWAAR